MDQHKRQKWCKEHMHLAESWAKVIWSDESNFQVINWKEKESTVKYLQLRNVTNAIYKQHKKAVEVQ